MRALLLYLFAPMEELVTQDRMTGREDRVVLELLYGDEMLPGALRVRQVGSNAVVEESTQGAFRAFLEEKPVKYIGQLLMYALQFKIQDLSLRIEGRTGEMKQLEDALDNCIDNSGTYRLLDFRRRYTECGNMVLAVKEILSRIDKGYYPMQMQNSYVLQGEVSLEFRFLEERYELIKSTVLKDFDTYTSIINNNINRNARSAEHHLAGGGGSQLHVRKSAGRQSTSGNHRRPVGCGPVCGGHGGLPCQPPRQCAASSGRGPIQTPSLPKFHRKEKRERDQWEK
ncbi:MAG: hypothetical protein ACLRNQ_28680 [Flavonifractor plautii]